MQKLLDFHPSLLHSAFLHVFHALLSDVERSGIDLPDGFDLWIDYVNHPNDFTYYRAAELMQSYYSSARHEDREYKIICELFFAMKYISAIGYTTIAPHAFAKLVGCRAALYSESIESADAFVKSILVHHLGEFS